MNTETTRIKIEHVPNAAIVRCLVDKLDNEIIIKEWGLELLGLIDETSGKSIIVSFKEVTPVTSSTFRYLITAKKSAAKKQLPFGICDLDRHVMDALRMTCLDTFFTIGADEKELLERFS